VDKKGKTKRWGNPPKGKDENMKLEDELKRLHALRERAAAVDTAITKYRAEVLDCIRFTGEARVAGAIDPDANPAKDVEARCKKLEGQRLAAQSELDKLTPEVAPLSEAIQRIERGVGAKVHAARLEKQSQVRGAYAAVARRLLETVNLLAELSGQARDIYQTAQSEFPAAEEIYAGQEAVFRAAGLRPIWDPAFTGRENGGSRRDVVVGNVFDWDRALVAESDPVALAKTHQERFFRERAAEYEAEKQLRVNPTRGAKAKAEAAARARGEQVFAVSHPLSTTGSWKA
jgi:hypothetical protein